jgi:hypothetical protein
MIGIALVTSLIIKRKQMSSGNKLKKFLEHYGTFFNEFTDNFGVYYWFYLIFTLRRLAIAINYMFMDEPILQLLIMGIFSLAV